MADLPKERLEAVPVFKYSGVDYFGPFIVRERRSDIKRWGVLFTCLSSRAIHIETANSLDTESFMNAYRRFTCRRGPIRELRCDQGTNFVGGRNELTAAVKEIDQEKIAGKLLKDGCDRVSIEPNRVADASHFGGVWERMILTVRSALTTLLLQHGQHLDDELLSTVMTEVECIVNSRPLTFIDTTSPDSPEPLSPSQLLVTVCHCKVVTPGLSSWYYFHHG
ncbi:uncharacterized protein LOC135497716 [Lineus longissimus]|uniref:uncharacterized protein LOC135497716 n=1 Tax=Lineus longissimus TaxID=88925 RepID=UPI00315CF2D4